jgi:hypothetical protein
LAHRNPVVVFLTFAALAANGCSDPVPDNDAHNDAGDVSSVDADAATVDAGDLTPVDAGSVPVDAGDVAPTADPAATGTPAAATSGSTPPAALDPSEPSYEVPVPDELMAFARYAVGTVKWVVKKDERRLEYTLPDELIGKRQPIELVGPETASQTWSLRGATFGTAECTQLQSQIECREQLDGLAIDVGAVESRVNAGQLPPERLRVTRVFQGDPIGILRFTVK